jgi:hypothetical protein
MWFFEQVGQTFERILGLKVPQRQNWGTYGKGPSDSIQRAMTRNTADARINVVPLDDTAEIVAKGAGCSRRNQQMEQSLRLGCPVWVMTE